MSKSTLSKSTRDRLLEKIKEHTEAILQEKAEAKARVDALIWETIQLQNELSRRQEQRIARLEGTLIGLLLRARHDGPEGVEEVLCESDYAVADESS